MSRHFKNDRPIEPSKRAPDDGWPIPTDESGKPNEQALVRRWGNHRRVPPEVWERFDEALERWHKQQRGE
jgi:hypothetical protein